MLTGSRVTIPPRKYAHHMDLMIFSHYCHLRPRIQIGIMWLPAHSIHNRMGYLHLRFVISFRLKLNSHPNNFQNCLSPCDSPSDNVYVNISMALLHT